MAKSFVTVGFLAVGVTAVTLLIIGHPHRQAQESRATPDAAKLAAAHSGPATGNAAALLPSPPADCRPNLAVGARMAVEGPSDSIATRLGWGKSLGTARAIGLEIADVMIERADRTIE